MDLFPNWLFVRRPPRENINTPWKFPHNLSDDKFEGQQNGKHNFIPHNKEVTTHVSLLGAINVDLLNMAQNCKKPVPNIGKLKFPAKLAEHSKLSFPWKLQQSVSYARCKLHAIVWFYPRPVFASQTKSLVSKWGTLEFMYGCIAYQVKLDMNKTFGIQHFFGTFFKEKS